MAVALYARVSTTRQAEQDLSIPDQLKQMREWCAVHGHLVAKEYIEPGASATDDRRPVFQEMIADASLTPPPYEGIIIHSLSRFFRDVVSFGVYEKRLKKHGVKIISITQQTAEDSSGELARIVFSAFDEYQSKENSKHTARAMRENARQGFFNGSAAPFGFQAVATEALGNRGRRKRKLVVDETEAAVVRRIYDLYLDGYEGRAVGVKEIAKILNEKGQRMRGKLWGNHKVHKILSSPTYRGEHFYNVIDSKTGKKRPPAEWIPVAVDPIVESVTFERVRQRREARSPRVTPPRRLSSPVLLTGLLRCGECGSGMTLATGKSGRYKYYKCTARMSKGNAVCSSRNLPMEKLDEVVLSNLADRVFTPERLLAMLATARKELGQQSNADRSKLARMKAELRKAETRLTRLYEALENGAVTLDDTFHRRLQLARTNRESVLLEMATLRRRQQLPVKRILPSQVQAFARVMRQKLQDRSSSFAKDYLQAVLSEVVVRGETATLSGSNARLMELVAGGKAGTDQVPSYMRNWRARRDSNSRLPAS